MKELLTIVLWVLVLDFAGFWFWALSGQVPADGFFIGAITGAILELCSGLFSGLFIG